MSLILIDRRKAGKGKSINNRKKLLKRVRSFIKTSLPQNIGQGGVAGTGTVSSSPVRVASDALEEPYFCYAKGGKSTVVVIGNDTYDRGDKIEVTSGEANGTGAGPGESGEDDFIVNVARDEFLDLFFDDCELPNLRNEKFTDKLENKFQQSGFTSTGNPSQLSVIRSYKQSLARRWAFQSPYKKEREELERELRHLEEGSGVAKYISEKKRNARIKEILLRLDEINAKIAALNGFDKVDLRYKKYEAKPLKTIESVLIMIMDISGSMGQEEKTIARRWFALLYAFIKRRYGSTDLVFIAHHDEAFEMNENDFFSTRINGGTSVSPALELANKIIVSRYDPNQTNIYVSHASDGDNWESDNPNVIDQVIGSGNLAGKIQMFSYVEVGKRRGSTWFSMGSSAPKENTNLWETYDYCRENLPRKKMSLSIIETPDDCYGVFKNVFKKDGK